MGMRAFIFKFLLKCNRHTEKYTSHSVWLTGLTCGTQKHCKHSDQGTEAHTCASAIPLPATSLDGEENFSWRNDTKTETQIKEANK